MAHNVSTRRPTVSAILNGALEAVRESPLILGLFLVMGIVGSVIPDSLSGTITFVAISIGVVIAYQALDGQIHAESSFLLRLLMAWLANLIALVPILLGMILFVLPGIYVLIRLFLATPAVMIDGYGPFEALSESWQLMDGSILSTAAALVIVVILGFAILFPLIFLTRSSFVTNIVASLIVGTLSAGIQAFLYLELAEPS